MNSLEDLTTKITAFRDVFDWKQFDNPKGFDERKLTNKEIKVAGEG